MENQPDNVKAIQDYTARLADVAWNAKWLAVLVETKGTKGTRSMDELELAVREIEDLGVILKGRIAQLKGAE